VIPVTIQQIMWLAKKSKLKYLDSLPKTWIKGVRNRCYATCIGICCWTDNLHIHVSHMHDTRLRFQTKAANNILIT